MGAGAVLLFRLIVRPMVRDRARALLTVSAVALGVAVIVAVDLAGEASMGSFRSSLESLQGSASYEITQVGGIPEAVYGDLARLEVPLAFSPRIEGFALVRGTGEEVPIFGVDLVGDTTLGETGSRPRPDVSLLIEVPSVWVTASLGVSPGDALPVVVGDRRMDLVVQGVVEPAAAGAGRFLLVDIALAERLLARAGRLDRIYVHAPPGDGLDWTDRLVPHLPPAASVLPAGTRTDDNRRMLRAFRWNLRMMSYTTILVGAFLIYNTITAYVVRRRQQIGIARAVGASRAMVRTAFLIEGAVFGAIGAVAGLLLGRVLAVGAVEAVGGTVSSLYVSSTPGEIAFSAGTVATAVVAGLGMSLLSPGGRPGKQRPSRRPRRWRGLGSTFPSAPRAGGPRSWPSPSSPLLSRAASSPRWTGSRPAATSRRSSSPRLARRSRRGSAPLPSPPPAACSRPCSGSSRASRARGLAASLGRTSVIVTAMAIAIGLVVSMGVTVGSFRETVADWLQSRLKADFYVSPVADGGRGAASTMSEDVAARLEAVPGVVDVGRFRTYPVRHDGSPATLGLADVDLYRRHGGIDFFDAPAPEAVWRALEAGEGVIASELFGYRHGVGPGDTIRLALGSGPVELAVAAVFYDYSGERQLLIADRRALHAHLPDPRLSSAGVYLEPGADFEEIRAALGRALAGRGVEVTPTRAIRREAIRIFDRTFTITYALEAIAIFVAILAMAEALLNLVHDRRSELALLRMHGASLGQVRRLVLVQAGLLGGLASLMGLALGAASSQVLLRVIHKQSFGWSLPLHWPWEFLVAVPGAIVVASVVAGLYPARVGTRLAPVEVLRAE